jgi:hypothetical protein
VARLVADLDHDDFLTRENAARELERIGPAAASDLNAALKRSPSMEFKLRAESLLSRFPNVQLEQRIGLRTIAILERLGTKDAREMLVRLADGYPAAPVTREAQAALDRLAKEKQK